MLPYNFRPSRPKATYKNTKSRLARSESMFHVERGVVSPQKRDTNQLNDSRNRSCLHRGNNLFKTTSQRDGLTLGERDIKQKSPQVIRASMSMMQTWPTIGQPTGQSAPKCFEYIQNYHHYILDIDKLLKGQQIPYLSPIHATIQTASYTPKHSAGLPKRTPKSASQSRRGSGVRKPTDTNKGSTLQEVITAEIKDALDGSLSAMLHQPSCTELKAPLVTPTDSPRSSVVYSTIPELPQSSPRNGVSMETHKPYLSAFTTRIPPLKSCITSPDSRQQSAKRRLDDYIPDYQRYRILCDAFRPCTPYRSNDRKTRPIIPIQVLDYCTHIVNKHAT